MIGEGIAIPHAKTSAVKTPAICFGKSVSGIDAAAPGNLSVTYIGRKRRSSPAEGDPLVHKNEQQRIMTQAITRNNEGEK